MSHWVVAELPAAPAQLRPLRRPTGSTVLQVLLMLLVLLVKYYY